MGIHQYIYLNKSKIDNLYAQLVQRVEEEYRTQSSAEISGKGSVKTGALTTLIVEGGGELGGTTGHSVEVISKLAPENKLTIIQGALKIDNNCTDINQPGNIINKEKEFISVKTEFTLLNPPKSDVFDVLKQETFEIEGVVSGIKFNVIFSSHSFISPSYASRLLAITRYGQLPLRIFGSLMKFDDVKKTAYIDPVAIH